MPDRFCVGCEVLKAEVKKLEAREESVEKYLKFYPDSILKRNCGCSINTEEIPVTCFGHSVAEGVRSILSSAAEGKDSGFREIDV